ISQACVIMLLGLGVDFGIQMMGRYEEELAKHHEIKRAIQQTLQNTGLAVLTGGGTTAIAFLTMCFNDFLGLQELGVISGTGIFMSVIGNLLVLPAMLTLRDRHRESVIKDKDPQLSPAFRAKFDQILLSKPKWILGAGVLVTVIAAASLPKVGYDYNLLNLQSPQLESVIFEKMLIEDTASSTVYAVQVADNREEAKRLSAAFAELKTVNAVRSVNDMLPEYDEEKLSLMGELEASLDALDLSIDDQSDVDVSRAARDLENLLMMSQEGLAEAKKYSQGAGGFFASLGGKKEMVEDAIEVFEKLIPPLRRSIEAMKGLEQIEVSERLNRFQIETVGKLKAEFEWLQGQNLSDPVLLQDLPAGLQQRYVSPNGKCLIEIDPKGNVWLEEPSRAFFNDLKSVSESVTGTPVQNLAYINLLRESYVQAAVYAFIAILVLITLHFRNLVMVGLTLIPLLLGVLLTGGTMAWVGIPFNPANIITLPLVIGIGVAFGVYVVDRYREEGSVKLFSSSTGKAILLSAITTMTGFLSMTTGDYVGLQSLGTVMSLGIFYCFLASVLILPQLLIFIKK
ncbi:MAG: MMPL family transporter, partial [Verrucomicrobiota bacterium]